MARRGNPRRPDRPLRVSAVAFIEVGADGREYHVRQIPESRAVKSYRCPGCDQLIGVGLAHVVVWLAGCGESGGDDRRHWHSPCWVNRANRGPTRRWS